MILLITPSQQANDWAGTLQTGTGEPVLVANSVRDALRHLRQHAFDLVIYDENYLDGTPLGTEALLAQCGQAVPVAVNFTICRMDRVLRVAKAALLRARYEKQRAHAIAVQDLRCEFKSAVTGILLSAEVALQSAVLPEVVQLKLRTIQELAGQLRKQLEAAPEST